MPAGEPHWLRRRRVWGVVLQVVTVGFAVLLALLDGGEPPSTATNALIVIAVAAAQVGAAWAFAGDGKAEPALAERSVARLVGLAARARLAEASAQEHFEATGRGQALHAEIGILSTEFSWIGDGLVEAVEDWRTFHPKAVERAEARGNDES